MDEKIVAFSIIVLAVLLLVVSAVGEKNRQIKTSPQAVESRILTE